MNRAPLEQLIAYAKHHPECKRGRVIEPVTCPRCSEPMRRVRNTSGYLNDDQFDAVKAGDWFCKRHDADCVYRWDSDCPKHDCTCGLAEALALVLGPQLESEREQIAAYVESCREPRDYVQVFDVLAKHIREGRHLAAALGHAGSPSRGRQ